MDDGGRRGVIASVAVLVVSLLVLGWVVLRDGDDPVVAPSPTATAASPTPSPTPRATTPSPTPTVTDTPSATPTPDYTPTEFPTGEDLQQVVQTILEIRDDAFRRREISILGLIYLGRCDCLQIDREAIQLLLDENEYVLGGDSSIVGFEVSERSDRDAAVVLADVEVSASERFDATSDVVVSTSDGFSLRLELALLRGFGALPDDQWGVAVLRPVTEESR